MEAAIFDAFTITIVFLLECSDDCNFGNSRGPSSWLEEVFPRATFNSSGRRAHGTGEVNASANQANGPTSLVCGSRSSTNGQGRLSVHLGRLAGLRSVMCCGR